MAAYKLLRLFLIILFFSSSIDSFGQYAPWGLKAGGSGLDRNYITKVSPNGNVFVGGYFSGTTDLDPSAAVFNITSNGSQDLYLACYSPSGNFLWGFSVGGFDIDGVYDLDFDAASNVFIVGYFRGQNVDFDPSASTAYLSDNGLIGSAYNWGGDGYIAKYTSTGQFQWAHNLGGLYVYDVTESVAIDEQGNVYIGGTYIGPMDIDPSSNTVMMDGAVDGKSYIIKYSNTGQLIWGFSFISPGSAGVDCGVRSMRVRGGYIYAVGFYEYYADFDPSAGVASSNAAGYDAYITKFDTAGNFIFVNTIVGGGLDYTRDVTLDPAGNIYIIGFSGAGSSTLSFGSTVVNAPGGGNNSDIFIAKYNNAGALQWVNMYGNTGEDLGESITYSDNHIFCTGGFTGTVDFDPSAAVSNLVSSGNSDVFLAKYDLNGNYVCAFKAGSTGADAGWSVNPDAQNNIYLSGDFSGTVDFDPSVSILNLTSVDVDAFLVKYSYQTSSINAIVTGDTICPGQQAYFTFTDSAGTGTYSINISDGINNYTFSVQSGVPFALVPNPTVTTTYTWNINGGQSVCTSAGGSGTFTINVNPKPTANAGPDTIVCNNVFVQLNGSGGNTYSWLPGSVLNNANTATPTLTVTDTNLTFTMIATNTFGCSDTDQVNVSVHQGPVASAGPDISLCAGSSVQLQGNGGLSYSWYPPGDLNNANIANPVFSGNTTSSISLIVTDQYSCKDTDDVIVTVVQSPIADAGPDVIECNNAFVQLNGSGGTTYTWSPAGLLNNANTATPTLTVMDTSITFTMITTNSFGCSDTDYVNVSVHQGPVANAGPDTSACPGFPVQLQGSGGLSYSWYPASDLNNGNIADPIFIGSNTATISLEVTDQYNCKDTDDVNITILPQPAANAGPDVEICAGASVTLQGGGGNGYTWFPTDNMSGSQTSTPTVTVNTTTTYYLVVTSGVGCTDTDAVNVLVIPEPLFSVSSDKNLCPGDSVMLYVTGGDSYYWYPQTNLYGNGNDSITVWPAETTTYNVVAATENTCNYTDTLSVVVNVRPIPEVQITKAGPKNCGALYGELEAAGALSYSWSPAITLDSADIPNPKSFTEIDTWYTVTGYSEYGCIGKDSALMRILTDNFSGMFIPSAFTPNDDGKNDCYRILLPPGIAEYELHIYNRFGNNVFNADDVSDCWDGTYKGEPCDLGVYYYYYKFKSPACGKDMEGKGDITLIR